LFRLLRRAALVLALLATACGSPSGPSENPEPRPAPSAAPPRVVIVSMDGVRPDAVSQGDAPNLARLAARGAFTWGAQTVFPPTTLPAHASMLSGYLPPAHGILFNELRPARGPIPCATVFSVARAAGLRTALVAGKDKFGQLNKPGSLDDFLIVDGDPAVASEAVVRIAAGFDLVFAHLPQTDLAGHAHGWMSAAYMAQLGRSDEALGRILAATPSTSTVIVTADHGGHDRVHGALIWEDMTIPWVMAGPLVMPGSLGGRVSTADTAATALAVLGLRLPPDAVGRVVEDAFVHTATAAVQIRP
jgi:predicted AlkP superfamily pyrophosphatase or phosphodiesterase